MKKVFWVLIIIVIAFVGGILLSDIIKEGINGIFKTEIETREGLKKKLK